MNAQREESIEEQKRKLSRIPPLAQYVSAILLLILIAHTAMIGLWVAPKNAIYDQIGSKYVVGYVFPFFKQSWSIFAPNPWSVDLSMSVRAEVGGADSGSQTTEWVDLIAMENDGIRGNAFHSRATDVARSTASSMNEIRADMDDEQRDVVRGNYRETSLDQMAERLSEEGMSSNQVRKYMNAEHAAVAIATGYAHHAWGDDVRAIQIKIEARSVPDFSDRKQKTLKDADPVVRDFGWRASANLSDEQLRYFEPYVKDSRKTV